jgi:uncharacterized protein (TIGR02594 family)
MSIPDQYKWLLDVPQPRIIQEALRLYGIVETPGKVNTPAIMDWAKETGLEKDYVADVVPWCGLFAAVVVSRAGFTPVKQPLWARNWAKYGNKSPKAALGDVLVFVREGGGHVGFYIAEDKTHYHVYGGNQGDAVKIVRIAKARCIHVRRSAWKVAEPDSVKPYHVAAEGTISTSEA